MRDNFKNITEIINKGEEISPFLFLGENTEMLEAQIFQLATSILDEYSVPHVNLLKLEDN